MEDKLTGRDILRVCSKELVSCGLRECEGSSAYRWGHTVVGNTLALSSEELNTLVRMLQALKLDFR